MELLKLFKKILCRRTFGIFRTGIIKTLATDEREIQGFSSFKIMFRSLENVRVLNLFHPPPRRELKLGHNLPSPAIKNM